MPQTVIVASQNPVKIHATRIGFNQIFPEQKWDFIGANISSGVSKQPMTDKETLLGAQNRAQNAQKKYPNAQFWVGIEGGCCKQYDRVWVFAWVAICSNQSMQLGRSSSFALPPYIASYLDQGFELGEATDQVFDKHNSKHKDGVIGALSHGHIDRTTYYIQPMILALMPFLPQP